MANSEAVDLAARTTFWTSAGFRCELFSRHQDPHYAVRVFYGDLLMVTVPCRNAGEAADTADDLWIDFVEPARA